METYANALGRINTGLVHYLGDFELKAAVYNYAYSYLSMSFSAYSEYNPHDQRSQCFYPLMWVHPGHQGLLYWREL